MMQRLDLDYIRGLAVSILVLFFPLFIFVPDSLCQDSDHDGISDVLEQGLLIKFAPRFLMSDKECDGLPAEFQPGAAEPIVLEKNGTIYGQVFQIAPSGRLGEFFEIHYYHLWGRDCGQTGHDLDAEHVSALIHSRTASDPISAWRAVYWYAAAHEDTICEASHFARGAAVGGEQQGPVVWISEGKHASFLSQEICRGGCGGDDCSQMLSMPMAKLLNLGEPSAAMNGALWFTSARWPLLKKMGTDFPESRLAEIDSSAANIITRVNGSPAPVQAMVHAGGSTASALSAADRKTDLALSAADSNTSNAAGKSAATVGRFLKRAIRAVGGVFFGRGK